MHRSCVSLTFLILDGGDKICYPLMGGGVPKCFGIFMIHHSKATVAPLKFKKSCNAINCALSGCYTEKYCQINVPAFFFFLNATIIMRIWL